MRLFLRIALVVAMGAACVPAWAGTIRVSAAVSLKEAMGEVAKAWEKESGEKVEFLFGSSGQLAAQIKAGQDVDVFVSAAQKQVDDLTKEGMVKEGSARVVAGNALVLIVPRENRAKVSGWQDLAGKGVRRVAMGEPKTVPAGQYGAETLASLKLTEALKEKVVYGANVRQVLAYVEMGEVDAGLVYLTDAKESGDKVEVVARAPEGAHSPIVYPGVVIQSSKKQEAGEKFLAYFGQERAKEILKARGFVVEESQVKKDAKGESR